MSSLLLGYDIGSSFVKACLFEPDTGKVLASASSPATEMRIKTPRPGWAEQDPEEWWRHVCRATAQIRQTCGAERASVAAIGISYQMHGLVAVDGRSQPVRPAIIWCDSRAVAVGERAADKVGRKVCLQRLLGFPGNFTVSKLRWVQENEPWRFARIRKVMLPGDYIAMRMTGEILTTRSGLSEAMLWDFGHERPATFLLDCLGIPAEMIPPPVDSFGPQGALTRDAAAALGLRPGIPLTYRAGDQPSNAFSLGVIEPGEMAVTAGTSAVVYAVVDRALSDPASRVNTFLHVNHSETRKRYGVLLCVNGAGILNAWLRREFSCGGLTYERMNRLAANVRPGSDGLIILPYGNGSERLLGNRDEGGSVDGWNFNVHGKAHFFRAAQEGVAFALRHGLDIMCGMGIRVKRLRAGRANMFLSSVFAEAFAAAAGVDVELFDAGGAQGAARGAGFGAGVYSSLDDAFAGLKRIKLVSPTRRRKELYGTLYGRWKAVLDRRVSDAGVAGRCVGMRRP